MSRLIEVKTIYGLTVENVKVYREHLTHGASFEYLMKNLEAIYESNKTLATRPLDYLDNVHGQELAWAG